MYLFIHNFHTSKKLSKKSKMDTTTSNTTTHTTAAGSSNAPTIIKILPCDRVKDPWENFNYVLMSDGKKKAQCKHCLSIMSASSNSMLKAHIKQKYCKALKNVPEAGLVIKRGLPFNH